MILQSLYDYYHRKMADNADSIAPLGFQHREIQFTIVIDENGKFIQLNNNQEFYGKKLRAKSFLVPAESTRSSSGAWKIACLLWDKLEYVCGLTRNEKADTLISESPKHLQSFINKLESLPKDLLEEISIQAIIQFLKNNPSDKLMNDPQWTDVLKTKGQLLFTFKLLGEHHIVAETPAIYEKLKLYLQADTCDEETLQGVCLITGSKGPITRLHPKIKGFSDQVSIVSFNASAYCSYGKEQSFNSPIGSDAAKAYTTALNLLLAKDSKQKVQLAGTTVVFWAEKQSQQADVVENGLASLFVEDKETPSDNFLFSFESFGDERESEDNPDQGRRLVHEGLNSPWTGKPGVEEAENRFFILGLAPNAARLAIRFWLVLPLEQIVKNMQQHFQDLEIVRRSHEQRYLPLRRLIQELCLQHKLDNGPPNLEGAFFECIVQNRPYPVAVLQAVIRRIRAEQTGEYPSVNYPRAALIKACLNREIRQQKKLNPTKSMKKEFTVALDETNDDIGYCLGRLFAAIEKIQEDSQAPHKLNHTVRSSYYGIFSSTPKIVFDRIMKLNGFHLDKLRKNNYGLFVIRDKLIAEISSHFIPSKLPSHMTLESQGNFSIGYYHQRQAFYTKKENANTDEADVKTEPALV